MTRNYSRELLITILVQYYYQLQTCRLVLGNINGKSPSFSGVGDLKNSKVCFSATRHQQSVVIMGNPVL